MAQPERRPEHDGLWAGEGCAQEMMSLSNRFEAFLQTKLGKYCQVKMCHADRLQPKMTEL